MNRICKWYLVTVSFFVAFLFCLGIGVLVLLLTGVDARGFILVLAIGVPALLAIPLIAVIRWLLKRREPERPDCTLYVQSLLLGGIAGVMVVVFIGLLWHSGKHHENMLLMQTAVLAMTAGFVVWYAGAAQRTAADTTRLADIGQRTADVQLLSRSVLFVTDPIETVGDYTKACHPNENLGCDKSHWLMIEITNEGDKNAMNVWAWASWRPGFRDVETRPFDRMQPLCKYDKFDGEEKNLWKEWRLPPGQSRLFYFRPPPCPERTDPQCGRTLRLAWYDVAYAYWWHDIIVFQREKDGNWHTNWWLGPQLHYHEIHMPLLEPPEKE